MGWFGRRSHSEVPSWASFFDDERFRAFLTVVEAELVSRGLTYELGDGVVALHGPGVKDGLTLGLQNLAQLCNHEPLAAWSDVVSGHFAGMLGRDAEEAELARRVHDFEAVRPSLRVRLYGEEVAGPERVTWPVADGLTAALVFDLPTAVRTVSAEDAGRWGRSREELYAIGLANALKEPVEVEEVQLEGGGVVQALMGPSFFTSARALSLDVPDDHPYGALVAVPHRHVVLVHVIAGLEVVRAINTMIVMTNGLFREGPGSISSDLYWSRGGTVRALPSSVDETGLTFRPPEEFLTEVLNRLAEPPSLGPRDSAPGTSAFG